MQSVLSEPVQEWKWSAGVAAKSFVSQFIRQTKLLFESPLTRFNLSRKEKLHLEA
jgi:hypothetical protein